MTAATARELLAEARETRWRRSAADTVQLLELAVERAEIEEGPAGTTLAEALLELSVMRVLAARGDAQARDASLPLARRAVRIQTSRFGARDRRLATGLRILGTHQAALQATEAFSTLREAVGLFTESGDSGDEARLTRERLVEVALELHRFDEALTVTLDWIETIPQGQEVELLHAHQAAGRALVALDRLEEGLVHLRHALTIASALDRRNGFDRFSSACADLIARAEVQRQGRSRA